MKKTGKAHLTALFFLVVACYGAIAQSSAPIFSAPTDTAQFSSSRYVANIRVSQFKKIIGTQFTLTWDPAVLSLDSVGQFGLPMTNDNNFGLLAAESGMLRFAWNEEGLKGIDLKDNSTLFSLFFRPIGKLHSVSPLRFTDVPTVKEVVDLSYKAVPAEFRNGWVVLGESGSAVTSVLSNQPEWLEIRSAFPNPLEAGSSLQVEFFLKSAQPVQIQVLDSQGKVIYLQDRNFSSGINRFELASPVFPVTGVYLIRLNQGDRYSTQKILFR